MGIHSCIFSTSPYFRQTFIRTVADTVTLTLFSLDFFETVPFRNRRFLLRGVLFLRGASSFSFSVILLSTLLLSTLFRVLLVRSLFVCALCADRTNATTVFWSISDVDSGGRIVAILPRIKLLCSLQLVSQEIDLHL